MRLKFLPMFLASATLLIGLAASAASGPPLRMDSTGIIQARGFNEVDAGINVQNGDLNIVGQGAVTVEPPCTLVAGTTCAIADATATATSQLVCGPVHGATAAASSMSAVLTLGTGWTLTVGAATSGVINCIKIK